MGSRGRRLLLVGALGSWGATVAAQLSTAFVRDPRRVTNTTVSLLTGAAWCFTARSSRATAATAALAGAASTGFAAEWIGTRTGKPFGEYAYSGRLTPAVGTVPVVVPLAWFAMGVPAYAAATAIVPATGAGFAPRTVARALLRAGVGACALTAWDLFLDPQMVHAGYWVWARRGSYHGIPRSNYVGWWLVSLLLMLLLEQRLGAHLSADASVHGLLGLYTSMTIVEIAGFLGPLEFNPSVAAIGGLSMGAICATAWWSLHRSGGL